MTWMRVLQAVVALASSAYGVSITIDPAGSAQPREAQLVRKDVRPKPHTCDDKTACGGCQGLEQSACETACWIDQGQQHCLQESQERARSQKRLLPSRPRRDVGNNSWSIEFWKMYAKVLLMRRSTLWIAFSLVLVSAEPEGAEQCPCYNFTRDDYGFSCGAHDINGCNKTSAPAWCRDSWCYVQPSTCTVTHEMSSSIPGLAWSYTTCGFRDQFSRSNITESLRGQTLRVQFLGNTGGWKGNYCPGFAGQPCEGQRGYGPVGRFFDLVAGNAGITVQQVTAVPDPVRDQLERMGQRSNFDLCIWATGMGYVDVCVASLVMLPRRTDASPFVNLWSEPTILVGPVVDTAQDVSFSEMLGAAFRPFSPNLWLTLLAVVTSSSLIITYFETSPNGQFQDLHGKREKAAEAVYRAFYSLFMCESRFEPCTLGGRIVGLGLAFMCILFVCGYTATLASFLVEERRLAPSVESLQDAIRSNYKICAHPSHSITLEVNGVPTANIVEVTVRSDILPAVSLESGSKCQVAVLSEEDFVSAQSSNGGSFCGLERIGGAIGSHMVGLSVSNKWARQLNYAVSSAAADGQVQRAINEHQPTDYCTNINAEIRNSSQPVALTVQGMLGPFLITMLFTILGILAHVSRLALFKTIEEGRKVSRHGNFRDGLMEIAEDIHRVASGLVHPTFSSSEHMEHPSEELGPVSQSVAGREQTDQILRRANFANLLYAELRDATKLLRNPEVRSPRTPRVLPVDAQEPTLKAVFKLRGNQPKEWSPGSDSVTAETVVKGAHAQQKTSFGILATHKKKHIRSMYSPRDLYSYPPSINSEIGWHLSEDGVLPRLTTGAKRISYPKSTSSMTKHQDNMCVPYESSAGDGETRFEPHKDFINVLNVWNDLTVSHKPCMDRQQVMARRRRPFQVA
ncbi:GLR3.2 [Symbiodinium microadriaticum]|nr:GLR3.2 [Symbiodinium microadriaticum]CAE7932909.1 GLR3.2 [Symbiodinium sp. KB8]